MILVVTLWQFTGVLHQDKMSHVTIRLPLLKVISVHWYVCCTVRRKTCILVVEDTGVWQAVMCFDINFTTQKANLMFPKSRGFSYFTYQSGKSPYKRKAIIALWRESLKAIKYVCHLKWDNQISLLLAKRVGNSITLPIGWRGSTCSSSSLGEKRCPIMFIYTLGKGRCK